MIVPEHLVPGYYGELVITGDLTPRCVCWFASMAFFLYVVYALRAHEREYGAEHRLRTGDYR